MTDDELEAFEDAMDERSDGLRERLAADLGRDRDDYRKHPLAAIDG